MAKRSGRVYWRTRGGERRAYGDFRDFADVGGGREALKPDGAKRATTDPDVAGALAAARVKALEKSRRDRTLLGIEREASLEAFAADHLISKARAGNTSVLWLKQLEVKLEAAISFFGADRNLASVKVADVKLWIGHLSKLPGRGGGTISPGTVRHYLNALSGLYRRAASEGYVPPGYNPVASLLDKPVPIRKEARWLEVHEAALFLEACRTYRPGGTVPQEHGGSISAKANAHLFPIVATLLLTGGRKSEVLGLEIDDLSFSRKTITFRENRFRRLKTHGSHRPVPMWPQLERILRAYLLDAEAAGGLGSLLFPSARSGEDEVMIRDLRKGLDAVALRAGWQAGEIRTKVFRHTYTAARLQTLDRGAPVSPWTVARELGHSSTQMVERIYGHLGQVRHRGDEVAFRIADHRGELGPRLEALESGEWAGLSP